MTMASAFSMSSTGMPKAVINTQQMMCANAAMMMQVRPREANGPIPTVLDWMPWNHTMGGNAAFNPVLVDGGTLYIDDGRPMPGQLEETIRNLREVSPTYYANVPAGYAALAAAMEKDEALCESFFKNLSIMAYGGARLPDDLYDRMQALAVKTTGERIVFYTGWGSTETAPTSTGTYWNTERVGLMGKTGTMQNVASQLCGTGYAVQYVDQFLTEPKDASDGDALFLDVLVLCVGGAPDAGQAVEELPLLVERAAQVERALVAVVASGLEVDLAEALFGRPLADHVDQPARHRLAVQHGGGAAQHLDPFQPVGLDRGCPEGAQDAQPVQELVGAGAEPADDGIVETRVGEGAGEGAGGVAQRLGDGLHGAIVELVAGDDGNRLRSLDQRRVGLGRGGGHRRHVALHRARAGRGRGFDRDGGQDDLAAFGSLGGSTCGKDHDRRGSQQSCQEGNRASFGRHGDFPAEDKDRAAGRRDGAAGR